MVRLIPEKTVELWTACSLVDVLGPDTWIWSPARYVDQEVWDGKFRKAFVLELKTPEYAPTPYITIDRKQLRRYVAGFGSSLHPDVIYVLPDALWFSAPKSKRVSSKNTHPKYRRGFAAWSHTICATDLLSLVGHSPTVGTASVRCNSGLIQYRNRSYPDSTHNASTLQPARRSRVARSSGQVISRLRADTLLDFLMRVLVCDEPVGTALRGEGLDLRTEDSAAPVQEFEGVYERQDLRLSEESLRRAVAIIGEGRRSRLLFVGVP